MCGITGILYNTNKNGIEIYQSLLAIQHRGQDGAGIFWSNTKHNIIKESGLINQIFIPEQLKEMNGNIYIAHNRYKTNKIANSYQPFVLSNTNFTISLSHNGNIININELQELLLTRYKIPIQELSDSHILSIFVFEFLNEKNKTIPINFTHIIELSIQLQEILNGSFCILVAIPSFGIIAIRDKCGIRPLSYGINKENEYLISSESCSFNHTDFSFVKDVQPGETIWFNSNEKKHFQYEKENKKKIDIFTPCLFEYIYFSRIDSYFNNISVYKFRFLVGQLLAKSINCSNIDYIIPTPDTSRTYAYGLSKSLNIPIQEAIVLNRYVNRINSKYNWTLIIHNR